MLLCLPDMTHTVRDLMIQQLHHDLVRTYSQNDQIKAILWRRAK
jgi:hypothetical protein